MSNHYPHLVTARLSDETYAVFKDTAARLGRSLSWVMRLAAEQYANMQTAKPNDFAVLDIVEEEAQ